MSSKEKKELTQEEIDTLNDLKALSKPKARKGTERGKRKVKASQW